MRILFDSNQWYQLQAIQAIADLFQGQSNNTHAIQQFQLGTTISTASNTLDVSAEQILLNLQAVQEQNGIKPDTQLMPINETVVAEFGQTKISFPNFSVEMETGTGKTYVYIRTALELFRRYGLRKYIIVVPSVAVREGVIKTLNITRDHLRSLYENIPYRFTIYESRNIGKVQQFAQSNGVEFLIMTIDSFNKDDNVIRQVTDRLQGATPIHLIQSVRPVLILDEPQNMESGGRIKALASLCPLLALRYSATHKNPYNLAYRLTPFDAYRRGLVKKIEVASVVKENDFNQVFLRLEEIRSDKKSIQAKICIHQRMANGAIKEKAFLFKPGACLATKAQRPEYETFVIDKIDASEQTVSFENGVMIARGKTQGADQAALFKEQIYYTVEEHFRKQSKLRSVGVKVLTLFFIDRVGNYTADAAPTQANDDGLYPGIIRKIFDEAFESLKHKYPHFAHRKAEEVRSAYFAQKTRRGGTSESIDSTNGQSTEDRSAYLLIMKDKEKLLSFEEPVSFIFSHSALREGWDNPNVCQICTLNQTVSEMKKRQEVGRGMRLLVNQDGSRVLDDRFNILTVIANESYEQFVASLQTEMEDAFGKEGAPPRPVNARKKQTITRKPLEQLPEIFLNLWEKIKYKTRYQVSIDSEKLIVSVVDAIDKIRINPPQIVASKAAVESHRTEDKLEARLIGQGIRATLTGRHELPNIVMMLEEMISHLSPPIKLTRRTLATIFQRMNNRQAALDNPQEFVFQAARIVREKAMEQLVAGIKYEKDGTWYDMSQWIEQIEDVPDERAIAADKSIYDKIVVQSDTERRFIEKLRLRKDVRLFVKLPDWFKVSTPIGNYNPDWALVMERTNEYGDDGELLYLVRETKSTLVEAELRGIETQKVLCGDRHFNGALKVDFKVVTSADELP